MIRTLTYPDIDPQQWQALIDRSPYATWFQTPEAYEFYAANPKEMTPFAVGIEEDGHLEGVIVGYTTQEKCIFKQYFTARTIIPGGPLLAEDISETALAELLKAVSECRVESVECKSNDKCRVYSVECKGNENSKAVTSASTPYTLRPTPIYIETRNFHDYSKWKSIFEANGFMYQSHLNYHVDTRTIDLAQSNIGKHRWKYIRLSMRDGAKIVENPTIEQVQAFYTILLDLYQTKVKTPLWSWEFFEQLYCVQHAKYILVELDGQIVGGTVCVCLPGKAVYEWYACGLDNCRDDIRPLSVAIWGEMQYAAENGYPLFDFMGAGKPDEPYGVRDFKAEFGGELVENGRFLCIRKPLLYKIGKMGVKWLKRNIK